MNWRRKLGGSTLAFIGFLLSPLSWWNDAFVNLPLAWLFGWAVSCFYPAAFTASVVLGYWLTNVLGLVLLHRGARHVLEQRRPRWQRELLRDVAISLAYTALIVTLIWAGILQPLQHYLPQR